MQMYLFYFFITAKVQILLGCYELNYAYIRQNLTLIFLHIPKPYRYTYYAINRASHRRPPSQFTRTSHKHLALYLAVYHLALSQFTDAGTL